VVYDKHCPNDKEKYVAAIRRCKRQFGTFMVNFGYVPFNHIAKIHRESSKSPLTTSKCCDIFPLVVWKVLVVDHLQFVSALPVTTRYRWRSLGSSVIVGIISSIEYTW
jgi:hypothetical protein